MSRCYHRFPRFSLVIRPYHRSLPTVLVEYVLCLCSAVVDKFLLVVLIRIHGYTTWTLRKYIEKSLTRTAQECSMLY